MLSRRRFTTLASATMAAAFARSSRLLAIEPSAHLQLGVQLYTVRDLIGDPPIHLAAALDLIRSIGYTTVETYSGIYDPPASQLRSLIHSAGLIPTSGHFDYQTLEEKVDYAGELGLSYMICPILPPDLRDTAQGFRRAAQHLNMAAAKANSLGLSFGYHPHNYEYRPLPGTDGLRGFDILMRELDPSVRLELDVYWAVEAGQNPLRIMQDCRSRLALIHIKDRKPCSVHSFALDGSSAHFTEAGTGTIDWKPILQKARNLGVRQFFVDQDDSDISIDRSLRANWSFLSPLIS